MPFLYRNTALRNPYPPKSARRFYPAILFIPSTHTSISFIVFSAPKANLTVPWGNVRSDLWATGAQ